MARPSPVPPKRRVVEASACTNFWKIASRLSTGMPMPVSITVISTRSQAAPGRLARRTWMETQPRSVNLSALPTRFTSTCRRRSVSPSTRTGTSGSKNASRVRFFASAAARSIATVVLDEDAQLDRLPRP